MNVFPLTVFNACYKRDTFNSSVSESNIDRTPANAFLATYIGAWCANHVCSFRSGVIFSASVTICAWASIMCMFTFLCMLYKYDVKFVRVSVCMSVTCKVFWMSACVWAPLRNIVWKGCSKTPPSTAISQNLRILQSYACTGVTRTCVVDNELKCGWVQCSDDSRNRGMSLETNVRSVNRYMHGRTLHSCTVHTSTQHTNTQMQYTNAYTDTRVL